MAFYTLLTNIGLAKIAAAVANDEQIQLTNMVLGDGNGNPTTPSADQTALVRQVYSGAINRLTVDTENPNYVIAELVVQPTVGGWTVHEVGIADIDGDLIAVGNFPATYKPTDAEGSTRDLVIRMVIQTSNASAISLITDLNIVVATRQWVVDQYLLRSKVAGGLTGQVLTKSSNSDEDFVWQNPIDVSDFIVDVKPEHQVLAASQTVVNFAFINAAGIAVYIEGVRLIEGVDFEVTGLAQITLAESYPDGTRLHAYQNEPLGEIPEATEDELGLARFATDDQTIDGQSDQLAVHPRGLTAALTDRPQAVATIAELEALNDVSVGRRYEVEGYLAGSSIGGGSFVAVPGSSPRDGVKTFVSANGVRLQRINIDTVTPYHAGWDGVSDAHAFVQACLDHYNDVYCPSGTYTVLFNSIKIERNGVTLRGDGESTIFVNKAGQTISVAGGVLKIAGTESNPVSGSFIRKVTVDYNRDNVTHTLDPRDNECISVVWGDSCEVSECRTVNGISEGIDIDHTINSRIVVNECTNNNGHGIHISSGSSQCVIMGNRCWDNGWVAFRAGMDCYEGFDIGGPNEIPESHNNVYVGNDCWDNYINYRILGPGCVFDGNKDHGAPGAQSNLSGVVGGVRAISSGNGERAKTIWQAKTSNDQLASFAEILNPDGNARFKLCYRRSTAGVESFIIASNTDNVLFEVFAGNGYETFTAAYSPASGSLSGPTYQNSTGYYVRNGKSVTFQLRLSLSSVAIGTAVGKLAITGLPVGPQVDTAACVNAMSNWGFVSPPGAVQARVRQSGDIELEIFNPNATTQEYVTAADLKTGSGSFLNQVYISGSFVTG